MSPAPLFPAGRDPPEVRTLGRCPPPAREADSLRLDVFVRLFR